MILEFATISNSLVGLAFGYVMWKFKKIENKTDKTLEEDKVRQLIEDKAEPVKVLQKEIKEDLERIERKMDKLSDMLYTK